MAWPTGAMATQGTLRSSPAETWWPSSLVTFQLPDRSPCTTVRHARAEPFSEPDRSEVHLLSQGAGRQPSPASARGGRGRTFPKGTKQAR